MCAVSVCAHFRSLPSFPPSLVTSLSPKFYSTDLFSHNEIRSPIDRSIPRKGKKEAGWRTDGVSDSNRARPHKDHPVFTIEAQCDRVHAQAHPSRHHRAPRHDCGAWLRGGVLGRKQTRPSPCRARQGKTCGRKEVPNCTAPVLPLSVYHRFLLI